MKRMNLMQESLNVVRSVGRSNLERRVWVRCACVFGVIMLMASPTHAFQADLKLSDAQLRDRVLASLRNGTQMLKRTQGRDGAWGADAANFSEYKIGVTSLAILALVNCDEPVDSPTIQRGLQFLRTLPPNQPRKVYEGSLYLMALCAAEEFGKDRDRILRMVRALEKTQSTSGSTSGLWGYDITGRGSQGSEDRSNGQFAVLALRDAAYAGFKVDREVWERTHEHWLNAQMPDGGWGYSDSNKTPRGSMTAAGLSTLAITTRMLQDDSDVNAAGRPDCCSPHPPEEAFEKGREWMSRNFTVFSNPRVPVWHYYFLYGLERAARLGNVRYFGNHDWYREGARYLVRAQNGDGSWKEPANSNRYLSTSFALLFLSKGLSRVVVNKLDYSSIGVKEDVRGPWNQHPLDIPNLIDKVDSLDGWPPH